MEQDCIFCKIVAGQIPSTKVYEDDQILAFRDIHPVAPVHVLIVPKKHIASINEVQPEDEPLMGRLFTVAKQVADEAGIAQSGYRSIINTGPDSGQDVHHLHWHVIGGQRMRHPMG